jgi:hypothetical protein
MAYKLGLLLSMLFIVQVIVYSGDISCISLIRSELDAVALTAGYEISMQGAITSGIVSFVAKEARAEIVMVNDSVPSFGEVLVFEVSRLYDPLIISDSTMTISVRRSAVIGYYA